MESLDSLDQQYHNSPLSAEDAGLIARFALARAIEDDLDPDTIALWGLRARSAGADISTILEPAE